MNLIDQNISDRLVEYVVVVGHRGKLIPFPDEYIEDPFASAPSNYVPETEDIHIEGPSHEIRYSINDFYGGPETDKDHPFAKIPPHPSLFTPASSEAPQRDPLSAWPEERIKALIMERTRIQESLLIQIQQHMFEADVLDRYPREDNKSFPFPDGIPLFCVPAGGLKVRKSPDIPRIYYFGCTMSDGGRLYGACLSFQEEIGQSHLRGLMRRMEQDLTHRDHWLSHAQYPPNHNIPSSTIDSVRDVDPNTIPLSVLERVRAEVPSLPQLWTSHSLCVLSCYPFLNEFRVFLTEIYRLTLTPTDVPIERLVATLVDDVPLPPQGLFTVQANVGPYNDQHRIGAVHSVSNSAKAAHGCLYPDNRSVNEYGSDSKEEREKLFKSKDLTTINPSIIPSEFKNNLTQAIQQSFLYFFKINSGRALEKNAIYGFNKKIAPLSLCGIHSLARDLLPPIDPSDQQFIPYHGGSNTTVLAGGSSSHSNSGSDYPSSSIAAAPVQSKSSFRRRLSISAGSHTTTTTNSSNKTPPALTSPPELSLTDSTESIFTLANGSYPNTSSKYNGLIRYPPPLSFQSVLFFRPPPNDPLLPASIRTTTLFYNLSLEYVILIIEALLSERKVLILSDRLSLLAPVCEALLLLLYPFRWLHVYVPLLPKVLNAFLLAPMPFLIGTTNSAYHIIDEAGIDDHVIVFLDENRLRYDTDIVKIPSKERKKLIDKLTPIVQFVKSKTPKDHHNPKYADSAFTLSPLPDDFDDLDSTVHKEGPSTTASLNSRSVSQHTTGTNSSSGVLYMDPSSSSGNTSGGDGSGGSGNVDPTIDISLSWDPLTRADYNIKHAFLRMFISIFRDVYDYIARPVDYSHISPSWASTTLPHPQILPTQQYARVVLASGGRDSSSISLSQHTPSTYQRGSGHASPIEDDTLIVTLDTTPPSQHQLASNSSVFRSQVAKIGADNYLLDDDNDSDSIFRRDAFIKSHPSSSKPFLQLIVHSQAFSRFIDERSSLSLAIMNRYHVVYFAESLIDKKNRSRFTRQKPTPFLQSTFHHFTSALLVPPPTGLQRGFHHFNQYHPSYDQNKAPCLECDCSHFSSLYTASSQPRCSGDVYPLASPSNHKQAPPKGNGECPLLHQVFHSHAPFVTRLPLRYTRFPRFDTNLFPLTMGRVPRIISVDGANILSFIRLQLGLLFCSGCSSHSAVSSCSGSGGSGSGGSGSGAQLAGGTAGYGSDGIVSPPPIPLPHACGSTFQTYSHTHASDIQFIPLNHGDVTLIKEQLAKVQTLPGLPEEFISLNLANCKTAQLAVSWSHVQTNVTKSILRLPHSGGDNQSFSDHAGCVFFWLDAISPHGHAPLPLTCESFDNVDPMYYALKQYKSWVTTWHKKLTIPDSTPAEDEIRLKQQQQQQQQHQQQQQTTTQEVHTLSPPVTPTNQSGSIQSALNQLLSPGQKPPHATSSASVTGTPIFSQPRPEGSVTPLIVPSNGQRLPPFPIGSGATPASGIKPKSTTISSAASTTSTINNPTINHNHSNAVTPKQINVLSMHPSLAKTQFSNAKYQNFASVLYNTVGPQYASSFTGVLKTEFMREYIEDLVPREYQHLQTLVSVYIDTIGCINVQSNPDAKRGAGGDLTTRSRYTRDTYIPSWLIPHLKQDYTRTKQLLISSKYVYEEMNGIKKPDEQSITPFLPSAQSKKKKRSFFWSSSKSKTNTSQSPPSSSSSSTSLTPLASPSSSTGSTPDITYFSTDDELKAFVEQGITYFNKIIPSLSISLEFSGATSPPGNTSDGTLHNVIPPAKTPPPFTPSSSPNNTRLPPPPPSITITHPTSLINSHPTPTSQSPSSLSSTTTLQTPSSALSTGYTLRTVSRSTVTTCCPPAAFGHAYWTWHQQAVSNNKPQQQFTKRPPPTGHSRTLSSVEFPNNSRLTANANASTNTNTNTNTNTTSTTSTFQSRSSAFNNPSSSTISIRPGNNYPSVSALAATMGAADPIEPTRSSSSSIRLSGTGTGNTITSGGGNGSTIVTSYATPVRGLLSTEELVEASKFTCTFCGGSHNLYLNIKPSHGYSSSPLLSRSPGASTSSVTPQSSTSSPIRVLFIPSFILLEQINIIFSQRPIELIQSPIFRKTYPEIFWSMIYSWSLLRIDFSQYVQLHQRSE